MRICDSCKAVNEDGVVFCTECSALLVRSSSEDIARRQATSLCPQCETYNSIELENCANCGHYLRGDSVVLTKSATGTVKAVRRRRASPLERWGAIVGAVLLVLAALAATAWRLMTFGLGGFLADNFGLVLCAYWGTLLLFAWIEWESTPLYKFKTLIVLSLAVIFGGWYLRSTLSTAQAFILPGLALDSLVVWAHLVIIVFASFCVLRAERAGAAYTAILTFMGIYGMLDPAYAVLGGHGYADYLGGSILLAGFPLQLQPSFIAYNLFLPYVFLHMMVTAFHGYMEGRRQMKDALSVTRLDMWNRDALRGSILDLFVVGLPLAFFLGGARTLGQENLLTYFDTFWLWLSSFF